MRAGVLGGGWVDGMMDDIVVDGDAALLKRHDARR